MKLPQKLKNQTITTVTLPAKMVFRLTNYLSVCDHGGNLLSVIRSPWRDLLLAWCELLPVINAQLMLASLSLELHIKKEGLSTYENYLFGFLKMDQIPPEKRLTTV